jgi:hypothetical protein
MKKRYLNSWMIVFVACFLMACQKDIKIKEIPSCTTPGGLAKGIAENYARMFTVQQITNN